MVSEERKYREGDDSRLPPRIHQEDLRGARQVESESSSLAKRGLAPRLSKRVKIKTYLERDEHDGGRRLLALLGLLVGLDGRREGLDEVLTLLLGHASVESEAKNQQLVCESTSKWKNDSLARGDAGLGESRLDAVEVGRPLREKGGSITQLPRRARERSTDLREDETLDTFFGGLEELDQLSRLRRSGDRSFHSLPLQHLGLVRDARRLGSGIAFDNVGGVEWQLAHGATAFLLDLLLDADRFNIVSTAPRDTDQGDSPLSAEDVFTGSDARVAEDVAADAALVGRPLQLAKDATKALDLIAVGVRTVLEGACNARFDGTSANAGEGYERSAVVERGGRKERALTRRRSSAGKGKGRKRVGGGEEGRQL